MPIDNIKLQSFASFCEFFRADGALRYAYIFDLPPKSWGPLLKYLQKTSQLSTYFRDNREREYPRSYEEIFEDSPDGCFDWIQHEYQGFSLASYCWYPTVFTMTADPRDLQNTERKLQKLLDTSQSLSQVAELPLVWSIDNWPPIANLRFSPNGNLEEVQYRLFL